MARITVVMPNEAALTMFIAKNWIGFEAIAAGQYEKQKQWSITVRELNELGISCMATTEGCQLKWEVIVMSYWCPSS